MLYYKDRNEVNYVSKLELLKFLESFDGEVNVADFSPQELEELLQKMQSESDLPQTKAEFKKKYFEFYDDIKDKSLKKQDW